MNNVEKRFECEFDHTLEGMGDFQRCLKHVKTTFGDWEVRCPLCDMEARVEHDNMWQEGSVVACETCKGQGIISYVCNGKTGIEAEYDTDECPDCEGVGWKHNGMNPENDPVYAKANEQGIKARKKYFE